MKTDSKDIYIGAFGIIAIIVVALLLLWENNVKADWATDHVEVQQPVPMTWVNLELYKGNKMIGINKTFPPSKTNPNCVFNGPLPGSPFEYVTCEFDTPPMVCVLFTHPRFNDMECVPKKCSQREGQIRAHRCKASGDRFYTVDLNTTLKNNSLHLIPQMT